jgi:GMP synthase-like glutamine amidotransferase
VTAPASPRALVVTHSSDEPPGTLDDWLPDAGLELDVVEPWRGDPLPERVVDHRALVVMGGPQQAYDETSASWLRATKDLLRAAVVDDVPVLGICLGAQLLAEALGGRVERGSEGVEAGARLVAKRDAAWEDPLFRQVPLTPTVLQWHEDAIVELPPGAVLLAGSPKYALQAFRVGRRAYGLQFHIEPRAQTLRHWAADYGSAVRDAGLDPERLAERAVEELPEVEACWRPLVQAFADLALDRTRAPLPVVER